MAKMSQSLKIVSYGLSVIYGLGLVSYFLAFAVSVFNESAILNSSLFVGKFQNITEFQLYSVTLWALFLPQFIGLVAVVRLKEWGRKLVICVNAIICVYLLYRMVFEVRGFDLNGTLAITFYLAVILFFNSVQIKTQFHGKGFIAKKRILVVDDDRGLLRLMKVNLSAKGYHIFTAETGEKGLEMARAKRPDLIVLDVILPGIKGREVCARLKNDSKTKDIPVVFLTAKNSPDDVKAELDAGAVSHVTKPLDSKELLDTVHKILKV